MLLSNFGNPQPSASTSAGKHAADMAAKSTKPRTNKADAATKSSKPKYMIRPLTLHLKKQLTEAFFSAFSFASFLVFLTIAVL